MYYVVWLPKFKQNFIVPTHWIRDDSKHREKHMNNGLNCSQRYWCFYTNDPNAFVDNIPKTDYEPKDNAVKNNKNGDGWFACKLRTFRCEFVCFVRIIYSL